MKLPVIGEGRKVISVVLVAAWAVLGLAAILTLGGNDANLVLVAITTPVMGALLAVVSGGGKEG